MKKNQDEEKFKMKKNYIKTWKISCIMYNIKAVKVIAILMERAVSNGFDSKHSYFIMILFNFLQFMPMVSTKIIR